MDIKFLKLCGMEAVKDSILHILDRACLLLFAFAMGMLAYTLMYGTAALYILILCAMVLVGIVMARTFLHSAMVHVRYPLLLYLKREKDIEETYSIDQLDKVSHLCEAALITLFITMLLPWCGAVMVVIIALDIILDYLLQGRNKEAVLENALRESVYAGSYFILFAIAVLFIKQQDSSPDSALSVLLAFTMLFPSVSMKKNMPGFFYALSLLGTGFCGAVIVLEQLQMMEIPELYEIALLCFMCIGPACFVGGMCLWKTGKERKLSLSAPVLAIPVLVVLSGNLLSLLIGVFLILFRLFLLPAMAASIDRGIEEREEDDDADIYALLVKQCDAGGVFAGMFASVLFVAGMTLLYLRGMVSYNLMLCGMCLLIGYMFNPVVCIYAREMKEMMRHHLHQS